MLSRNNVSSEEWTLHPLVAQKIWEVCGRARVDLFASEDNSHCPIFLTKSTDALVHEWPSLRSVRWSEPFGGQFGCICISANVLHLWMLFLA